MFKTLVIKRSFCFLALLALLLGFHLNAQQSYDLVIVGGTPGGIMSAIAAAREGKSSVILERTEYIGGLPANGLGATDIQTRRATTGLFKEFTDKILKYYSEKYGENSEQVKNCSNGLHFEPHVAQKVFDQMLAEQEAKITILKMEQFDAFSENVVLVDRKIVSIKVTNRLTGKKQVFSGKMFIDATYEGDLAAAAGVPYVVGREAKNEYNERGAGRVYRYWKGGPEAAGTTFLGDDAVQAYNYRLCLTNDPAKRKLPIKPTNYNRDEYISLVDDVFLGRHIGVQMRKISLTMMEENRKRIEQGERTKIPGDLWGIDKIVSLTRLPNKKTDANNQHMALISTDLPEENWPWPTATWEWRDQFAKRLKDYTVGLLWFAQNDEALPVQFRNACKEWGFANDEYIDNDNFPRQVYVREGRRFKGNYFFLAQDAIPVAEGKRPPLHSSSITASHYAHDSHAVRKREKDKNHLDGFVSYPTAVYTVPLGVIVPKEIDNLLFPVPVSGSHIGFSTLRMEPCWMALGQAAGIAASIAAESELSVQSIPIEKLQGKLVEQKATLIYFEDISIDSSDFAMVQYMGVRGYLQGWKASLDGEADVPTIKNWSSLSKIEIDGNLKSRRDVLNYLYKKLEKREK